MHNTELIFYILVMAGVTYLSRAVSLVLFRDKIRNRFLYSFINYTPYGVLAVLVVPDIFFSTGSTVSGIAGSLVALALAYFRRGLLTVAVGATLTVFLTERILTML